MNKPARLPRIAFLAALAAVLVLGTFLVACEDTITAQVKTEVRIAALPDRTLTILTPSNGTSTPVGVITVKDGESYDLVAAPYSNFLFDFWQVSTGASFVSFEDDHASTTSVRLSGGNATIVAVFADIQVPMGTIAVEPKIQVGGDFYVKTKTPSITLTATDNVGVTEMKLAESSFATGTPTGWIPYNSSTTYSFTSDGSKTLYVRFKDGDNNESSLYSTQIKVDSTPPVPTKHQVDQISPAISAPLYVPTYNTNLQLTYAANDAGSGVAKVYFSNTSSKPAIAQIDPYAATPVPYLWSLNFYDQKGYYKVYFWFEDKVGNVSPTPYTYDIRYDDKWEGRTGNTTWSDIIVDGTSGATIGIDPLYGTSYGTTYTLAGVYSGSYGSPYLVDSDYYKWGFAAHDSGMEYPATVVLTMNAIINVIGDFPLVSFYDQNGDDVFPDVETPDIPNKKITYVFNALPYINTSGHPYYFYMYVGRPTAAPYSNPANYNVSFHFDENEIM